MYQVICFLHPRDICFQSSELCLFRQILHEGFPGHGLSYILSMRVDLNSDAYLLRLAPLVSIVNVREVSIMIAVFLALVSQCYLRLKVSFKHKI